MDEDGPWTEGLRTHRYGPLVGWVPDLGPIQLLQELETLLDWLGVAHLGSSKSIQVSEYSISFVRDSKEAASQYTNSAPLKVLVGCGKSNFPRAT